MRMPCSEESSLQERHHLQNPEKGEQRWLVLLEKILVTEVVMTFKATAHWCQSSGFAVPKRLLHRLDISHKAIQKWKDLNLMGWQFFYSNLLHLDLHLSKKKKMLCQEPVGIGNWVLGMLLVWMQGFERSNSRKQPSASTQQEHRVRIQRVSWTCQKVRRSPSVSLEAVLPKDRYGVRTCKLKTNGDTGPSAFTTLCSKLHVIEFQVVYKCEEDFPGPFPAVNSPSRFLNPDSLKCKPHCLQSRIEKAQRFWGCNPERDSKEWRSTGGSTLCGRQ